jgi:hypothetical protein
MSSAQQRTIAAKGGRTAHALGKGHQWTAAKAVEAGRKGGLVRAARRRDRVTKAGDVKAR